MRRCIPEGLNFCATGEPYWTVDIGGFFVDYNPSLWFWRGDYETGCRGLTDMMALVPDPMDTGCADLGFHELYTRWVQYAAFLPMFRSHGTDGAREIWRFGEEGNHFYDTIAKYIRLRYRLLSYVYSLAAEVTHRGRSMIRHIALDFPRDTKTHNLTDQFLFGSSLMICPVTTPMYYGANSAPITSAEKTRDVYLPAGSQWYDFWTGQTYDGGRVISVAAPLETLPIFVKAGSIIPFGPELQYASEKPADPLEIRVYPGADGKFILYEDEGDNYNYETGGFSTIEFTWDNGAKTLTIGGRKGEFPGMLKERTLQIVWVDVNSGDDADFPTTDVEVHYTGAAVTFRTPGASSG